MICYLHGRSSFEHSISEFSASYSSYTITIGPGKSSLSRSVHFHNKDYSSIVHRGEKLQALKAYLLSRLHRRDIDEQMNAVEAAAFMLIRSSKYWFRTKASPFCEFTAVIRGKSFHLVRYPLWFHIIIDSNY